MEETITLKSIETKTTKAGAPMWTAMTSIGKMSCFDKTLAEQLFTLVNKNLVVETGMNGNYKNLIRVIRLSEFAPIPTAAQQAQVASEMPMDPIRKQRLTSATMLISYAKDLCVAGKIEVKEIDAKAKELLALYEDMLDMKFV
jgi:hypothetical protein